jgi:hypothetical protein
MNSVIFGEKSSRLKSFSHLFEERESRPKLSPNAFLIPPPEGFTWQLWQERFIRVANRGSEEREKVKTKRRPVRIRRRFRIGASQSE